MYVEEKFRPVCARPHTFSTSTSELKEADALEAAAELSALCLHGLWKGEGASANSRRSRRAIMIG